MMDCEANPNDPVCQAFYGTEPPMQLTRAFSLKTLANLATTTVADPGKQVTVTNPNTGTITTGPATITPSTPAGYTRVFGRMYPTWWLIVGAGALAAGGYALHKRRASKPLSGFRRVRRR